MPQQRPTDKEGLIKGGPADDQKLNLAVMGIPMSQRVTNGNTNGNLQKRGPAPALPEKGLTKSKTAKEAKEQKEKLDADYKQSIEGLSIIGTSANNKK